MFQVIAVAIGPAVFFYKNMKPYYKYMFPSMAIDPLEREIWRKVCYSNVCFSSFLCIFLSIIISATHRKTRELGESH